MRSINGVLKKPNDTGVDSDTLYNVKCHRFSTRGFTLIELLVVIAIIGVLATVIIPSLNSARDKATNAKRIAEADGILKGLEQHLLEYRAYPDDGVSDDEVNLSAITADLVPEFTAGLPDEIQPGTSTVIYRYCATDDLENFHLRVLLVEDNDASTTPYCGVQRGTAASSSCPNAALDDLCRDRL